MRECVHRVPKCVCVMFVEWVCLLHGKAIMPMTLESARCSCNLLNFLDLAVNQNPQGISCDMFDKHSQPQVLTRSVCSNISDTAKFGVINNQFYRCLRLCCCKDFFVSQMVNLVFLLKNKGYPLRILLKRTRGLLNRGKFLFGISVFGVFQMILYSLVSWELFEAHLFVFPCRLFFSCVCSVSSIVFSPVFLFCVVLLFVC